MAKKQISSFFIFLVILAVIGGIVYFKPFQGTSIDLQEAVNGAIVRQLFGYAKCEATGGRTNWIQGTDIVNSNSYSKISYRCEDFGDSSCNVRFTAQCSDNTQDNLYYTTNKEPSFLSGIGDKAKGTVLKFSDTESKTIYLTCQETIKVAGIPISTKLAPVKSGGYDYNKAEYGVYLYTEGYGKQGLFSASLPECTFISTDRDVKKVFDLQDKTKPLSLGTHLPIGRTDSFTVGWVEVPAVGNINPAGQYKNQDVMCDSGNNGATITGLEKISTVGGKTYYLQKNVLASGIDYCCPQGNSCSGGYVCEKYQCVQKPVTCQLGQCNSVLKNSYIDKNICEYKNGQYTEYDKFCDAQACIQNTNKETVKCCEGSCGLGKICDKNVGCVDNKILKECPVGQCCVTGGQYKAQSCQSGLSCCFDLGNDITGTCKTECQPIPPEEKTGTTTPNACKPLFENTLLGIKIDNPFCNLKQRLGFISILLGVLTGLGALGIGLAKFKKKKDASLKVIVALFSVILGVLVYFLIQNAFDFIFSFWGIVTIFIVIVFLLFLGNIRKAIGV